MKQTWVQWRAAFAAVLAPEEFDRVWRERFCQCPEIGRYPRVVNRDTEIRECIAQGFDKDTALLRPDPKVRFPDWLRRLQHGKPAQDELHTGATEIGTRWSDATEIDEAMSWQEDPNATKPIPALV